MTENTMNRIAEGGSGTNGQGGERPGELSWSVIELNPSRAIRVYNESSLLIHPKEFPCSPFPESVWAIPSATSP